MSSSRTETAATAPVRKEKHKDVDVSFVSDDDEDDDGKDRSTTATPYSYEEATSDGEVSSSESSKGEKDDGGDQSGSEEETVSYTISLQPSTATDTVDRLPDVVSTAINGDHQVVGEETTRLFQKKEQLGASGAEEYRGKKEHETGVGILNSRLSEQGEDREIKNVHVGTNSEPTLTPTARSRYSKGAENEYKEKRSEKMASEENSKDFPIVNGAGGSIVGVADAGNETAQSTDYREVSVHVTDLTVVCTLPSHTNTNSLTESRTWNENFMDTSSKQDDEAANHVKSVTRTGKTAVQGLTDERRAFDVENVNQMSNSSRVENKPAGDSAIAAESSTSNPNEDEKVVDKKSTRLEQSARETSGALRSLSKPSSASSSSQRDAVESSKEPDQPSVRRITRKHVMKSASADNFSAFNDVDPDLDEDETATTGASRRTLDNEESGYRVRRNSIDEFIRRILAEAREEQKKMMDSVAEPAPADEAKQTVEVAASGRTTHSDQLEEEEQTKKKKVPTATLR